MRLLQRKKLLQKERNRLELAQTNILQQMISIEQVIFF